MIKQTEMSSQVCICGFSNQTDIVTQFDQMSLCSSVTQCISEDTD